MTHCDHCGTELPHIENSVCPTALSERYKKLIDERVTPEDRARIKRTVEKYRHILDDPRMADDYNAETGERDGIPYWERQK